MIFQHTIDKVLSGEKTQTRRLSTHHAGSFYDEHWGAVYNTLTGMPVWVVGKDYAAQPGRGKAAVARIRIVEIRQENVRDISHQDAVAEGFVSRTHFMLLWTKMHDPEHYKRYPTTGQQSLAWEQGILADRPAKFYSAWALTFRLVK